MNATTDTVLIVTIKRPEMFIMTFDLYHLNEALNRTLSILRSWSSNRYLKFYVILVNSLVLVLIRCLKDAFS
jgi:hypothetical protein